MIMRLLNKIKRKVLKRFGAENLINYFRRNDKIMITFGVCGFIRNNFLWNKRRNVKRLAKIFGLQAVDDISIAIFESIMLDLNIKRA